MAKMAPATYAVHLKTEVTGFASQRGVRFWVVITLLAIARLIARSKIKIRTVETRDNLTIPNEYKARLEDVAKFPEIGHTRSCARCEASGVKLNDADGIDLCDGCTDEVLRENGLDPETLEPLDKPCDRCHRPGLTLEPTRPGLLLCGSCRLEVARSQRLTVAESSQG